MTYSRTPLNPYPSVDGPSYGLWIMKGHFWCKIMIWFPKKVRVMRGMGYEGYGLRGVRLYMASAIITMKPKREKWIIKDVGWKRLPSWLSTAYSSLVILDASAHAQLESIYPPLPVPWQTLWWDLLLVRGDGHRFHGLFWHVTPSFTAILRHCLKFHAVKSCVQFLVCLPRCRLKNFSSQTWGPPLSGPPSWHMSAVISKTLQTLHNSVGHDE